MQSLAVMFRHKYSLFHTFILVTCFIGSNKIVRFFSPSFLRPTINRRSVNVVDELLMDQEALFQRSSQMDQDQSRVGVMPNWLIHLHSSRRRVLSF